jgi:P-type Ca2+ transporter type 2C
VKSTTPEFWHSLTAEETLAITLSSADGLSSAEATVRLNTYGHNIIESKRRNSPFKLLFQQFQNVLIITLLIATALSALLGHGLESVAIAVIVVFAVLLGFIQEYKAEKAIEALRDMAAPKARVRRDGVDQLINATDIVPGDILLLYAGDRVAADCRLLHSNNLRANEASLTGESLPSEKDALSIIPKDAGPGDRRTMVFAGTSISYGRASAIVVSTAMQTEFGKIASMLLAVETEKTPLQKNLDNVGSVLARMAFVIVLIIVALGVIRGQSFIEMLIFGIALAVAVVPEALPAVVTISLSLGVQRMVKRHALMRRLPVVETLGSTSVICSDKTGTLTRDEMTVRALYTSGMFIEVSGSGYLPEGSLTVHEGGTLPESLHELLLAGVLCNDAGIFKNKEGAWQIEGDPTEAALLVLARKAGLDEHDLQTRYKRLDEQPFSSETKRMITLHQYGDSVKAIIKGAPEVLLADCKRVLIGHDLQLLDESMKEELLKQADAFGNKALRVLAIAVKAVPTLDTSIEETTFLGLAGMIDSPRLEAAKAVRQCIAAGIRPVMITGDHPLTAEAISRELGILRDGKVVTGSMLQIMSDEELSRQVGSISVFARVSPQHKLRIVEALQKNGEVVAMTGDGVNDAPALKRADIGISMGITGTDVSKEASAMMLTDDNFASIIAAVEEGRGIYDNIKKYLTYLLSSNFGELGLMAFATIMGLPLPLSAVQLLYVNLATDGFPALALAVDPVEPGIMLRRPTDPKKGIFTPTVLMLIFTGGIWSTIVNLTLFQFSVASGRSLKEAMTMTFVSLVLIQFFKAYNFRSETRSILNRPFANRWLNLAIGWELVMLAALIYIPFLRNMFGTFLLTPQDMIIVLGSAVSVVPVIELLKWFIRKRHQ